jgi:hypothetical protein
MDQAPQGVGGGGAPKKNQRPKNYKKTYFDALCKA